MAWRDDPGGREPTSEPGSSPADPFEGMRDIASNPYASVSAAGYQWSWWDAGVNGKLWLFTTTVSGVKGALPPAPAGRKWVEVLSWGAYGLALEEATGLDDVHTITTGPVRSLAPGAAVTLGAGGWVISIAARVDQWTGSEQTLVSVPAGTSLLLENLLSDFRIGGPFAGVIGKNISASATVTYQSLGLTNQDGKPWPADGNATFGQALNASLTASPKQGVEVRGDWHIDQSNPKAWKVVWPSIFGSGNAATTGLETLAGIGKWLATWGPWILLALGVVLAFWFLPQLLMLLVKGAEAWKALAAAFAAL